MSEFVFLERKISVNSIIMINKGLDYIESCYLFNIIFTKIIVGLHPQFIEHL